MVYIYESIFLIESHHTSGLPWGKHTKRCGKPMGKRVFVKISTSMVGFPRVSFREGKLVIEPIIAGKR